MVSNLVENLTRDVMLELAGESYFERGEDYHRGERARPRGARGGRRGEGRGDRGLSREVVGRG